VRASFCVSNVGTIVSSSVCGGVLVLDTADGASAWANNEVGVAWIEKAIHKPPKVRQIDFTRKSESANGADGISNIEGKPTTVAASELGSERVSNLPINQCFCRN
jgi:hypothetical protein